MARDQRGWTPLHLAARWGTSGNIQTLLNNGANLMSRDQVGWTPLHHTVQWETVRSGDKASVITALLEAGADVKAKDQDGKTPWDYAQKTLKGTKGYWALNDAQYN